MLLPLLAQGLPAEGLDNSADMLARCRAKAEALDLTPRLHQADMTSFHLEKRLSLIFCAAGTFTLLARPGEMEACLAVAVRHLLPGGLIALGMDAPRPPAAGPVVIRDIIRGSDGARLRCTLTPSARPSPDVEAWEISSHCTMADRKVRTDKGCIAFRRPAPLQLSRMLEDAGLTSVALWDATGDRPMHPGDESYLAIAEAAS